MFNTQSYTVTVCTMYTIYSSMAADVSFVRLPTLLLDTFQLQVKFLNVNQLLLRSLPQTVRLSSAHKVMLLFCFCSKVICFLLQSLCFFL